MSKRRTISAVLFFLFLASVLAAPAAGAEITFLRDGIGSADGVQRALPADLDRDGDLDVIAAVAGAGTVTWWRNDGGGTWVAQDVDPAFAGDAVAVLDVDRDGDLDVAAASSSAGSIAWWENDGSGGGWTEHAVTGLFAGANSLHAADLDGDGDLDLVATAFDSAIVAWWKNDGGATWTRTDITSTFGGARWAASGDFDRDGDLDVVAVAALDDEVAWWENTGGDGQTWSKQLIDGAFVSGSFVATGDVDGDGRIDVLGAAWGSDEAAWWRNVDGVTWTHRTITTEDGARTAEPVDLDDDGDLDVLIAGNVSDRLGWWENVGGSGQSWAARSVDAAADGAASIVAGDFDCDGDLDLLGAAAQAGEVFWWRNASPHGIDRPAEDMTTTLTFPGMSPFPGTGLPGDLDGDGDVDLLYQFSGESLVWLENLDAAGGSWATRLIEDFDEADFSGQARALADLDGDGDLDAVVKVQDGSDQRIDWFENTGVAESWPSHTVAAASGSRLIHPVDLDGDGDLDLVAYDGSAQGFFQWWENLQGDATAFQRHIVGDDLEIKAEKLTTGDIDRDGDLDVLMVEAHVNNATAPVLSWWRNDDLTFQRIELPPTHGSRMAVADFDADGDLDVMSTEPAYLTFDELRLWQNDGSGTFTFQAISTIDMEEGDTPLFRAEDVNVDGFPDIAGSRYWIRNPGKAGTGWRVFPLFSDIDCELPFRITCERSGDWNGDGVRDFLLARWSEDDLDFLFAERGDFELRDQLLFQNAEVDESIHTPIWALDFTNHGVPSDPNLRLSRLAFSIFDGIDQLPGSQVDTLFSAFRLARDDGSGDYDAALDQEVASLATPFTYQNDSLLIPVPAVPAAEVVSDGEPARFFLTATAPVEADSAPMTLRIVHRQALAEAVTVGDDAPAEILGPINEDAQIILPGGGGIFEDGFESGDTSAWSMAVN